jgi:hypothetical protein
MKSIRAIAFSMGLLVAAIPAYSQAVRTFVSTNGNDANPCTLSLPCRSFGAAIAAVASSGEVVALDSGGYGSVTISHSVSLIAPPGVHAAIAPTSGAAIYISAGAADVVTIRGLYLHGQGAVYGVYALSAGTVHVERATINRFAHYGLIAADGLVIASNSVFAQNDVGAAGYSAGGGTELVNLMLSSCRFENDRMSLATVIHTRIVCVDCSFTGGNEAGVRVIANSGYPSEVILERAVISGAGAWGISAVSFAAWGGGSARVEVSDSTITGNADGVSIGTDGCGNCSAQILSRGNNTLEGNTTNGTFSGTFPPK